MSFKVIFATEISEMSLKKSALKRFAQSKPRRADNFPLESSRCAFRSPTVGTSSGTAVQHSSVQVKQSSGRSLIGCVHLTSQHKQPLVLI